MWSVMARKIWRNEAGARCGSVRCMARHRHSCFVAHANTKAQGLKGGSQEKRRVSP